MKGFLLYISVFSTFRILSEILIKKVSFVPVAQLDRASDYESEGWEFESLRARHVPQSHRDFVHL